MMPASMIPDPRMNLPALQAANDLGDAAKKMVAAVG